MEAAEEWKRQRDYEMTVEQSRLLPAMRTMLQPGVRMLASHERMIAIHDKVQQLIKQAHVDDDEVQAAHACKRALEQSVAHRLRSHWLTIDRQRRRAERDSVIERIVRQAAEATPILQEDARKLRRVDHEELVSIYSKCLLLASSIDDFQNMVVAHSRIAFHQSQSESSP